MVGHLLRNSSLMKGMIEGPRVEYTDEIKGGRKYVVIKRLSSEEKNWQAHHILG